MTGCEAIRRLCFQLVGGYHPSFLQFFKLDAILREGGQDLARCLPSDLSLFLAKMDLRGAIEQIQASDVETDLQAAASTRASLSHGSSARVELAAPGQDIFEVRIHQRLEKSNHVTILVKCKLSDKIENLDSQLLEWSGKGTPRVFDSPKVAIILNFAFLYLSSNAQLLRFKINRTHHSSPSMPPIDLCRT